DPYTVVIKTSAPNAMVPQLLTSLEIMPKHVLEPAFKAGTFEAAYSVNTPPEQLVTSGPFKLQQYVPNEKTVLIRNPYWFGVDQQRQRLPYLDELVFLVVPDQDALDLKFRSGEIDGNGEQAKPENYGWYADHQKDGNFRLYDLGAGMNTTFFW